METLEIMDRYGKWFDAVFAAETKGEYFMNSEGQQAVSTQHDDGPPLSTSTPSKPRAL